MNFKKLFSAAMAATLTFSFSICGSITLSTVAVADSEPSLSSEQLSDLYDQGFIMGSIAYSDGVTTANYTNEAHTEFRQVVCTMTDEQRDVLFSIDYMAEDYERQCKDALSSCTELRIVTPDLPDASLYEAFAGKTVGDMEDEGFDFAGSNEDEDGNPVVDLYAYTGDDVTYTVRVYPEGIEEGMIYDDDAIRELVVGKVIFWEFN